MEKYDKVHLWIGTTHKPKAEYEYYFKLDYSKEGDFDDPDYKVCGFCRDIGKMWYDEDFMGIFPRFEIEVDIDEILMEADVVDAADFDDVKSICNALGIDRANAFFWYVDADLTVPAPYKENYNGLKYIGLFASD